VRSKIVTLAELLERVETARRKRQTIVHCHGCFDIVHPGHVRYLDFARRQGDLLVVSLTGDLQITKGDQRPYIPEELRAENLAALEMVDLVYIDPHPTACELLGQLRPDLYVKGREYEQSTDPAFLAERAVVEGYGGKVLFSSGDVVYSSGALGESIPEGTGLAAERLALYCRRYGITHDAVENLLGAMAGLRVLVVGDVIIDRYVFCDAVELAGEAPMMSLARLEERLYLGGAGVVARHVAGLGARTFLVGAAADDRHSALSHGVLEGEGVETRLIPCRPRMPERTRYLVDTTKVLRVEDGECHPMDSAAESGAVQWVAGLAGDIDLVIYCDFGLGSVTAPLIGRLAEVFRGRPCRAAVGGGGGRSQLLRFRDADLLCPTERDLRGALHDFDSGLSRIAWGVLNRTDSRHMLVNLGRRGVVVFDRQSQDRSDPQWRGRLRSEYLAALDDRVVDPLGADDAMLAAAALALAAGGNLMQCAYLGSAAMAAENARLGNVPLDSGCLRQFVRERIELGCSFDPPAARPTRIAPRPVAHKASIET